MTYSVAAKCHRSGAIGVAVTSATINTSRVTPFVHGVLPTLSERGFIASLQSCVDPMIAYESAKALDAGATLATLEEHLGSVDSCWHLRQVGILTVTGETWAHTGASCWPHASHVAGDGFVVLGNAMTESAIPAMVEACQRGAELDLAERLMRTLEAGMAAGGQQLEGQHLQEYSSSLAVYDGRRPYPAVDLRVDFDLDAVSKLRRLLTHITGSRADAWFEALRSGRIDQLDLTWIVDAAGQGI